MTMSDRLRVIARTLPCEADPPGFCWSAWDLTPGEHGLRRQLQSVNDDRVCVHADLYLDDYGRGVRARNRRARERQHEAVHCGRRVKKIWAECDKRGPVPARASWGPG